MDETIGALHPRKLYALLRANESSERRARSALEFLRNVTAAEGGFLFLAMGKELALAAAIEHEPPSGLVLYVSEAWQKRRPPQQDDSVTLDVHEVRSLPAAENVQWTSSDGEVYERRLLSTYRAQDWVPVGVVMLRACPGRSLLPVRRPHVEAICNALIDAGDCVAAC